MTVPKLNLAVGRQRFNSTVVGASEQALGQAFRQDLKGLMADFNSFFQGVENLLPDVLAEAMEEKIGRAHV